ncbi:MAG: hypothetical protein E7661_09530 [Ruminococcaceae bacterium]|nr:hypothetical protein [Oscillospiraceae bacterium]
MKKSFLYGITGGLMILLALSACGGDSDLPANTEELTTLPLAEAVTETVSGQASEDVPESAITEAGLSEMTAAETISETGGVTAEAPTEAVTEGDAEMTVETTSRAESVTDTQTEVPTEAETASETLPETYETLASPPEHRIYTRELRVTSTEKMTVDAADLTEGMENDKRLTHVRISPSLGYTCVGFEAGGVLYGGNVIPLSMMSDGADIVLRMDYATYELPIVNISVEGREITSKTEYVDMTFSLENTEDIMIGVPGGIRMRGNSTADMPKKPYRIKFAQKQSLFGLDKARSWVLLAEYLDPSCLHNYAAMYLAAASDELEFTPTIHHVNLYLDGEYQGLYSLCEQVEEERLGIEMEITSSMRELTDFSFLVCMDERAPEEDKPYFFVPSVGRYFQLKYPAREDFAGKRQFELFMTQLEAYYNEMADAFNQRNNNWFKRNLYTGTLMDHLIVDQIMGEEDHVWKSFYTYHDATDESRKGKIRFGPIWDYDYCLYTPWTGEPNECYDIDTMVQYSNFFYRGFVESRYGSKVAARYSQHYADVLAELIPHLETYHDSIKASLALNQERWYSYDPNLTEDNFDFMIRFFKSRQKVLGKLWG